MSLSPQQVGAVLLAAGLLAGPGRAQDFDKELERPEGAVKMQQSAAETAEAAAEKKAAEGSGGVSYEDVLADPDNIELNYKFAKSQIARGNLRQAAATLERILMVDPALPKVRLTYAIILYRLDNLPEAQRELNALRALPMPASLKDEIDEYLDRIKRRRRRTNVSGRLGFGWQYDSNRNAAPRSAKRLFGGTPLALTSGHKEDDPSYIFLAQAGLVRDLGFQEGHNLFADMSYYRAEQIKVNTLDFQAYNWDFGGTVKSFKYGNFTPKAVFGYISLKQRTYLRQRGVDFGYEKAINDRWSLFSGLGVQFQEFVDSFNVTTASERTGQQTDFRLGSHFLLTPGQRLTVRYEHSDKDARRRFNMYTRESFHLSHAWLTGKGTFLLSQFTVNADDYGDPETAIHPTQVRKDVTTRTGLIFGAPLSLLARPLKDLLWTANLEHFDSSSNMTNYEYKNTKVNMMVTYKFDY